MYNNITKLLRPSVVNTRQELRSSVKDGIVLLKTAYPMIGARELSFQRLEMPHTLTFAAFTWQAVFTAGKQQDKPHAKSSDSEGTICNHEVHGHVGTLQANMQRAQFGWKYGRR